MLFNSYLFIFIFLPALLLLWQFTANARPPALWKLLLAASALFYGLWGLPWLALLVLMLGINYILGAALAWNADEAPDGNAPSGLWISRKSLLACALILNLLPLVWFKYSWFIIENLALALGTDWRFTPPGLPLGISFYTFIQIAWLVGIYRGQFQPLPPGLHAVFSSCFAYVISGPIVRQDQLGWQLEKLAGIQAANLANGMTLFAIGLAKKVILADSMAFYADAVFNAASKGWGLAGMEAWYGALAYSFQLYFDFSGYTDMALGIGLMIGLRLPENFNSPYKATGIIDFWRRWHMTLSSWLRDFLYIPLGGNRHGKPRQYLNLFLTMLIGGAWHGAGWTYIAWGAMHGGMLCANHGFRAALRGKQAERLLKSAPAKALFVAITFFCLVICWVMFRATDLDCALAMYKAMFYGPLWSLPPDSNGGAQAIANIFGAMFPHTYVTGWQPAALLLTSFIICWLLPNSRQIMEGCAGPLSWRPATAWAVCMAFLGFISLFLLSRQTAFLYFQF